MYSLWNLIPGGDDHSDLAVLTASYLQPLYHAAILQMLGDNFVDVILTTIAVPNLFRVNHHHRAFTATIETAGIIDAYPTLAMQTQLLDPLLGVFAYFAGIVVLAAILGIAVMGTEKCVVLIIRHD